MPLSEPLTLLGPEASEAAITTFRVQALDESGTTHNLDYQAGTGKAAMRLAQADHGDWLVQSAIKVEGRDVPAVFLAADEVVAKEAAKPKRTKKGLSAPKVTAPSATGHQ